ncbi:hypothetical protein A2899_04075 [Candidatus Amesbacteria bacterium RIFCSPLOWO2_01_FULL_49_25]|uniref:Glycosyltransferase RgtA/B/C/D-like domain-containing protein n=1 Tax=Candidatus Amesbacteria bacterium RIFCSPHIGHO2_01_FULL_48_32b TaxID=1797253 RepID=A0A1F4YGR0_9BACT|nr:MAG: hypothetical protein A2876_00760 [Candidatus Amesbacteria bacterium RIFCSPHIGHO2_01_FULL_48_32b]OGD07452.1 MAG: hypothetical protein A2899_04075 [Candidatus Amesbacteria bacterium RIFCSPLOWO2_01_FULL_49_25]
MTLSQRLALLCIIFLGFTLRSVGRNWDQNYHLHPDERFLTMVVSAMSWPKTISEYFDTSRSLLNPHNIGFGFYVYGTYPAIFVRYLSQLLHRADYSQLTLVGRAASAVIDTGTIVLVFLISSRLFKNTALSLISALMYALSVLPIQLSHFFAVDPYAVFFLTLSLYLLLINSPLLGIAFGLTLAAKISSALFLPVIALGLLINFFKPGQKINTIILGFIFVLTTAITLRVFYPYLFTGLQFNPKVLQNWKELDSLSGADSYFPPAVQWLHTRPVWYSLSNLLYWGLGLPLGLLSLISLPYVLVNHRRHGYVYLVILWVIGLFFYQSTQFAQPMRYLYPIYPFLAVTAGAVLFKILKISKILLILVLALTLVWPLAFVSIYTRPHSRLAASKWIYQNVPSGSTLSCDHWDDCLPIGYPTEFRLLEYPLYGQDTPEKWQDMSARLAQTDYIIMSSNRLFGSISSAPDRYPAASKFYADLFSGKLGFSPVVQFTSRPNLPIPGLNLCLTPPNISYGAVSYQIQNCPLPGLSFVDDYADETFTVYDHPKVIIFKKSSQHPKL